MKFVIGWLTLKPGTRDEFMTLCRPFIAATREEEGVDFFEFHNDLGNSDGIVVVERYKSHEAHELHWTTPHFQAMWHIVQAIEGRFENIFADRVERDIAKFGVPGSST